MNQPRSSPPDTADAANTPPVPNENHLLTREPADFPGLISFWDFSVRSNEGSWPAKAGSQPYTLREQGGAMQTINDAAASFTGRPLEIKEGQWLSIQRDACPALDIHGPAGHFTLLAWIKRGQTRTPQCEFIAGQWNETNLGRQYGLFLNIRTWNTHDQICGHLSTHGGPTPGYKYCCDGPMGQTAIDREHYHCIAMSYDAHLGYVWLDGQLDARTSLNPYLLPGGLHRGGPDGSDFTVGSVHRSGEMGNFFVGQLAGLAIYERVLSPAEMWALGTQRPAAND